MSYFSERIPEVGGIDYMYTLDGVVCQWNLEIKVPTLDYLVLLKKYLELTSTKLKETMWESLMVFVMVWK